CGVLLAIGAILRSRQSFGYLGIRTLLWSISSKAEMEQTALLPHFRKAGPTQKRSGRINWYSKHARPRRENEQDAALDCAKPNDSPGISSQKSPSWCGPSTPTTQRP